MGMNSREIKRKKAWIKSSRKESVTRTLFTLRQQEERKKWSVNDGSQEKRASKRAGATHFYSCTMMLLIGPRRAEVSFHPCHRDETNSVFFMSTNTTKSFPFLFYFVSPSFIICVSVLPEIYFAILTSPRCLYIEFEPISSQVNC